MAWADEELRAAEIIHGPERGKSDTYRLRAEGKWLDVPGWMVGDEKMALLRLKAARIIRERLTGQDGSSDRKRSFNG